MPTFVQLPRSFYARPTLKVARDLLGKRLIRNLSGERTGGYITEAEAYIGGTDLGCHAKAGRTRRTAVMFGPPGFAYVYFTYGNHWMLNFVTEAEDFPAAVLIRAIFPVEGLEHIAARREGQPFKNWTDGPGKICKALDIDGSLNGADLCKPDAAIIVEEGIPVPESCVTIGPRVGLNSVPEPWKSIPWRFRVLNDEFSKLIKEAS